MSLFASKLLLRSGMALSLVGLLVVAACSGEAVPVADNGAPAGDGTAGATDAPADEPGCGEPGSKLACAPEPEPPMKEPGCGEPGNPSPCIDSSTLPQLFECGTIKCNASFQYCQVAYGGIQGDFYNCVELPADCRTAPSCTCAMQPFCQECSDEGGQVTLRCAVG